MTPPAEGPAGDVSVVIPVLNAARHLPALLSALRAQRPAAPREVILVDSGSTDGTPGLAAAHPEARVVPIADFSHGRARNLGAREAKGAIVALLTQDALPSDPSWLARLLEPFADASVAAAYSRQVPREDATPMERFFLLTRFPPGEPVRRERRGDAPPGLEDVFFSNVAAAVRRDVLLAHPFDEALIMSEDQQFARDVLQAGYATVYQPASVVVHSHRYGLGTVFRRYFDSVYSLTEIFPGTGWARAHRSGSPTSRARRASWRGAIRCGCRTTCSTPSRSPAGRWRATLRRICPGGCCAGSACTATTGARHERRPGQGGRAGPRA